MEGLRGLSLKCEATANSNTDNSSHAGALITLPIRLIVGWTYFSAFWRRVALADSLNPDLPGYIGEKFNHFLPNAIGIGPIIEYLITHPDLLRTSMTLFTIVEGIVGACVLLGLFTRMMSVGVVGLAFGILISAGWLGTTCLDEWQIGVLGVACGFALFLSGGGRYSLDHLLATRNIPFTQRNWFVWVSSGKVNIKGPAVLIGSIAALLLALTTNQYFHGGVYGPLHNKSVAPVIRISDARIADGTLRFQLYRTEGVDVYGSFLIGVAVVDDTTGASIVALDGDRLSQLPSQSISNRYTAKVKPGAHSLIVPLGAKAELTINIGSAQVSQARQYRLVLSDISGATWQNTLEIVG